MNKELSGLELRRAACEALGVTIVEKNTLYSWSWMGAVNYTTWLNPEQAWPAIESDPAVSEVLFLEWCAKHDYEWQMSACRPHGPFAESHVVIWLHGGKTGVFDMEADGSTPSEARARSIVAASQPSEVRE